MIRHSAAEMRRKKGLQMEWSETASQKYTEPPKIVRHWGLSNFQSFN
jgi:hypothetical protein